MNEQELCCQIHSNSPRSISVFDQVIALDYYDGPLGGFLRCGGCNREFRFRLLAPPEEELGEVEMRIFGLYPVPAGTISTLLEALAPYERPKQAFWMPAWTFPSDEIRDRMDALSTRFELLAGPLAHVFATSEWLSGQITASRSISPFMQLEGTDWFAFLDLIKLAERG